MNPSTIKKRVIEGVYFQGHEVRFIYVHHLNSKSKTMVSKRGTLIRQVRSRKGTHLPTGFWMVRFPGNKGLTKVHESRLINITLNPCLKK